MRPAPSSLTPALSTPPRWPGTAGGGALLRAPAFGDRGLSAEEPRAARPSPGEDFQEYFLPHIAGPQPDSPYLS